MTFRINNDIVLSSNNEAYVTDAVVKNTTTFTGSSASPPLQGTDFAFVVGGNTNSADRPEWGETNRIDRFPFASDTNATNIGTLYLHPGYPNSVTPREPHQSSTHGYIRRTSGPWFGILGISASKYPFATQAGSDFATTLGTGLRHAGTACSSESHGYIAGGVTGTGPGSPITNTVDRFPFASDAVINLGAGGLIVPIGVTKRSGNASPTYGYLVGGGPYPGPGFLGGEVGINSIDKFPFASSGTSTDVGDLISGFGHIEQDGASDTHGYHHGGFLSGPPTSGSGTNAISKYPFSSNSNATSVGVLAGGGRLMVGHASSQTHGYAAGGVNPGQSNVIEKYPFSTDTNSTDIGDLSVRASSGATHSK